MEETYRKHIFCEKAFLEQCISHITDFQLKIENVKEYQVLSKIKALILCPDVKLHLDIAYDDYESIISDIDKRRKNAARKGKNLILTPYEQIFLNISIKQQNNEIHLKLSGDFPDIRDFHPSSTEQLNALYLTTASDEECQKASEDYGVIVINPNNIGILDEIMQEYGYALHKNDSADWKESLCKLKTPCNSLVIVDNYILNDTNLIRDNLCDLFDAVLPDSLNCDVPFHMIILTTLRNNKSIDVSSKDRYDLVMNIIKEKRPNLNVELCIVKNGDNSFHDRTIITNYSYIECGAGFDIFKNGLSQKTTTVKSYCLYLNTSTRWISQAYTNLLSDIYKVYRHTPEFIKDSMPNFYTGSKNNRLMLEMANIYE